MARTHGRLFCSIWDDNDFLALTPEAKNVYSFLLSQEDLSHAGTIIMRAPLWAEMIGYTDEQTDAALNELHDARFVVTDRRRFELLVRSLIRRDGVYKQPNVYKSAIDHIYMVKSKAIRAVLLSELTRLDESGMNAEIRKVHHGVIDWLRANSGDPSPNPSAKGSGNPSGNPSANPDCPVSEINGSEGATTRAMSEIRQDSMIALSLVDNDNAAGEEHLSKGSGKGSGKGSLARAFSPYPLPLTKEEPSSSATATPIADKQKASKLKRTQKQDPGTPRPDVEALCTRLVELMVGNGCNPPDISQAWRDAARLLLDKDKRDFGKAMALLEWCQADEFWHTNIHSMPTFRRQYEKLRQKANAEWRRNHAAVDVLSAAGAVVEPYSGDNVVAIRPNIPAPRPSTTDRAVASGDIALAEFRRITGRTA